MRKFKLQDLGLGGGQMKWHACRRQMQWGNNQGVNNSRYKLDFGIEVSGMSSFRHAAFAEEE